VILLELKMAWRNVWRNTRRSVLTVMAIGFACTLLVFTLSFQLGSYATMINSSVTIQTGHLQIQARGYQGTREIRKVISDPAAVTAALADLEGIRALTSRARAFGLISSDLRSAGGMVVGIDPAREARVSTLEDITRQGSYLPEPSRLEDGLPPALVGRLLARNLQVKVGDELTILGQGRDGSVAATVCRVHGITSSGMDDFDRGVLHVPLEAFQEVFAMGRACHEIVILAQSLGQVSSLDRSITSRLDRLSLEQDLAVLTWDELLPGLRQAITLDLISGGIFYLILVMVVAFSILNTFLMAIFERTKEFGMMMAIGTRPMRLTRLVLTESASMTLLGVLLGIIGGCVVTLIFERVGINLAGSSELLQQFGISGRIYPRLSLLSACVGPGVVFAVTLCSALFPALRIRKLSPVEALA
jgi:ABC-type lipoprotein release transport system permease subunit